jgi:hypothetical protein
MRLVIAALTLLAGCCPCPKITDMRIVGWAGEDESKILLYDPATGRNAWVRKDSLSLEDYERFSRGFDR